MIKFDKILACLKSIRTTIAGFKFWSVTIRKDLGKQNLKPPSRTNKITHQQFLSEFAACYMSWQAAYPLDKQDASNFQDQETH